MNGDEPTDGSEWVELHYDLYKEAYNALPPAHKKRFTNARKKRLANMKAYNDRREAGLGGEGAASEGGNDGGD